MNYLLDVNVLVAWGWSDHTDHSRVAHWIQRERSQEDSMLLTSAIPQLGFVRVSVLRSGGQITVEQAAKTLTGMLNTLGSRHSFVPDMQAATHFLPWCRTAAQTTDAHLSQLAEMVDARLATCDQGIPKSFLIPR